MEYYSVILAFHLISIIVWITVLVYMQKLILLQVIHRNKVLEDEVTLMYKYVAAPSFISTILFGIILISINKSLLESGVWIYLKFFFISLLITIHHLCSIYNNQFKNNTVTKNKTFFTYFSYTALILVAIVVLLTLVKPF